MKIVAIYAIYTTTNYLIVTKCNNFLIDLQLIWKCPEIDFRVISVFEIYRGT